MLRYIVNRSSLTNIQLSDMVRNFIDCSNCIFSFLYNARNEEEYIIFYSDLQQALNDAIALPNATVYNVKDSRTIENITQQLRHEREYDEMMSNIEEEQANQMFSYHEEDYWFDTVKD